MEISLTKKNPLSKLTRLDQEKFLQLVQEKHNLETYDKFHNYFFQDEKFDDKGQDISRHNYKKHTLFMDKTAEYRELAFIAPNRVGKSYAGGFMVAAWAMKDYPDWWKGKVFPKHKPLEILVVGKTNEAIISTTQKLLVGTTFDVGSGMIPKNNILEDKITKKPNCPGGIKDLYVKDKYGCTNHIQFMTSEAEDDVIMGRELHVVWFDEECMNSALYNEAIMRTMTCDGLVFTTFTPMDGLTTAILRFMPSGLMPENGIVRDKQGEPTGCYTVHCGWNDVPHLPKEIQDDIKKRYTGAELLARTEGIPSFGSGHIYPVAEQDIRVETFAIPDHWPRLFAVDFGWEETAVVWMAQNPDTKVIYVYDEYAAGHKIPAVHVEAIKLRGDWIPGTGDPAGVARNGLDGSSYMESYARLGINLVPAMNMVQTGITNLLQAMECGGFKVMSHCEHWFKEKRTYRYDNKRMGEVARNQDDHLLDATRYGKLMFEYVAMSKYTYDERMYLDSGDFNSDYTRDPLTGY